MSDEQFNFIAAREAVASAVGMPPFATLVLLSIIDHMPTAYPSTVRISARTRLSVRQVVREIKLLESNGIVTVERSSGVNNKYSLPRDWISKLPLSTSTYINQCHPVTSATQSPVPPSHPTSATQSPHQCHPVTLRVK